MSFTRIHDEPVRIKKQLQLQTNAGRYALMTPGPGTQLPYIADPHYRLEKWGANYMVNGIGIENDLHGLTRHLTHDDIDYNDYLKKRAYTTKISYPVEQHVLVEETRATVPAFQFREANMYRWETPFLDPQFNIEIPFSRNLQSRIIEKDIWTQNYLAKNKYGMN